MYLNVWQLPELSQFPKGERKQVYLKYIHPLLMRWPVMLGSFVFNCLIILSLVWLPGVLRASVVWIPCYFVADHFFKLVTIILQRPRLNKMMEDVPLEKSPSAVLNATH